MNKINMQIPHKKTTRLLEKGTTLYVAVNPSGDYDRKLLSKVTGIPEDEPRETYYIPVHLIGDMDITYRIVPKVQKVRGKIGNCVCCTPAVEGKNFETLNQAVRKITNLFQPMRISEGGSIYTFVYFQDKESLELLEVLRERVYELHKDPFEEYLSRIAESNNNESKHLQDSNESFKVMIEDQLNMIDDLQIELSMIQRNFDRMIVQFKNSLEEFEHQLKSYEDSESF